MERSPFLPLPDGMVIGQVEITPTQPWARCPGCGNSSDAVHCRYRRTVHDVPCGGRSVVLRLGVRKFFCRTVTCQRKVFAERLPDLVQPWARISNRLPSRGAAFLMILPTSKLTKVQQQQVAQMNLNEDLRSVYLLSQEFVTMLKENQGEALDSWLKRAKACHVTELTSFVNGIRRD